MADGHYRFQGGAGHYYSQHNPQSQAHRQVHLRTGSPTGSSRIGFNTDTPSPSRSPGRHSPPHSSYGMYGQNHQQSQNVMMNGHQRFGMGMNLPKQYQGAGQHPNHSNHHQQDHQSHNGHNSNFGSHQHNSSASGFSSAAPYFQTNHMRNGTPNSLQNGMNKPQNEQWAQQVSLAQLSRETTMTHSHAQSYKNNSKGLSSFVSEVARRDGEREERNRASTVNDTSKQEWLSLDCSGQGLRALAPQLFEYRFLDKLYLNSNRLTYLPGTIGLLRGLTHLDLSLNLLSELPAEVGMLVNLKQLLLFDNQLDTLPNELGSLYKLEMLGVEGNPLNDFFKHIIVEQGTREMITRLREQAEIPEAPTEREWIVLDETEASRPSTDKLLVMTYNTLCDKYAPQSTYGYTPMEALSWDHRKGLILDEVRGRNADIVCLQEVDAQNYNDFFRPELARDGYKGAYWSKSRYKTMTTDEAKLVDGCATFFKDSKFVLLDKQVIDFRFIAINRLDMKGISEVFNRIMPYDNIAVVTFLEDRMSGERFIIVNAHIYWDPAFCDVKMVQTAILMEEITKIADSYTKIPPYEKKALFRFTSGDSDADKESTSLSPEPLPSMTYNLGEDIPVIMCGDFNSTPDSGVYDLITRGSMSPTHPDLGNWNYGNLTRDGTMHPFKLKSSYSHVDELSFTNYTPGFTGVIDYIWYSTKALQVTGLLGEVDKEYLQRVPGFPNYHFPSDHLALVTEFIPKASVAAIAKRDRAMQGQ